MVHLDTAQEIGEEEHLQNHLFCVKWDLVLPEWFCFSGAGLLGCHGKKAIKRM